MIERRAALGLLSAGLLGSLLPCPLRARNVEPLYLSAHAGNNGDYSVIGFRSSGVPVFEIELPERGHSFAVSPDGRSAVHFSRRPGVFALAIDLIRGTTLAAFSPPDNRRFQGHGAFGADGQRLYVSENDFEKARGVIGVYDVANGYARVGEFPSYGIGPHEIALLPDGSTLAVANGGIATHPDMPRVKLNLPEMSPSLTYIDRRNGALLAEYRMDAALHQLGIRHLAIGRNATVAVAMQYEGPRDDLVPLVALKRGNELRPLSMPEATLRAMKQYCGSIAFDSSGRIIATSAPRGNIVTFQDADTGVWLSTVPVIDGSGIAPSTRPGCFIATSGLGDVFHINARSGHAQALGGRLHAGGHWDNHLVTTAR